MKWVFWCEFEEVDVDVSDDSDVGGVFRLYCVDCRLNVFYELVYVFAWSMIDVDECVCGIVKLFICVCLNNDVAGVLDGFGIFEVGYMKVGV